MSTIKYRKLYDKHSMLTPKCLALLAPRSCLSATGTENHLPNKNYKNVKDNIQQCSCFTEQQGHASWKGERLSRCQWLITLTPHSHPTHAVTHLRSTPVRASLWEPAWESDQKHRQLKRLSRWNSTKETVLCDTLLPQLRLIKHIQHKTNDGENWLQHLQGNQLNVK